MEKGNDNSFVGISNKGSRGERGRIVIGKSVVVN